MSGRMLAFRSALLMSSLALACAKEAAGPLSPSAGGGTTNGETVTLKVGAPTPVTPVNDQQPSVLTLVASAAVGKFATPPGLQYQFEVFNAANVRVVNDTRPTP